MLKKYQIANNKFMGKYFDKIKKVFFTKYLDANSLYPTVMSKFKLPYSDFKRVDRKTIDILNERLLETGSIFEEGEKKFKFNQGCTFKLDLHYPKNIHKRDNDFVKILFDFVFTNL